MKEEILEVLNSANFKKSLTRINLNYSNLKQENLIRNSILEEFNSIFEKNTPSRKAFAEHPRIKNSRVDLSIVDNKNIQNPFLIELKYQFNNDYQGLVNFKPVIKHDFERYVGKQINLFILIVASWDKDQKEKYDKIWGISTNLNNYTSKDNSWEQIIEQHFCEFSDCTQSKLKIAVSEPYETTYNFYLLNRN
jgi:ribosomal protein S8